MGARTPPSVLQADGVQVWLAFPEDCQAPDLMATYLAWLDAEERRRYDRFQFAQHRHHFLVAHALLRSSLAQYGTATPAELQFTKTQHGRPELVPSEGLPGLRFNLSHTTGLVACAITPTQDVGLDVENTQRSLNMVAIAKTYFAPEEFQALPPASTPAQRDYFFNHWTLKEAYAKAKGLGLYLPFRDIAFRLNPAADPAIELRLAPHASPLQDWQFTVLSPTPVHRLALAVNSAKPLQIIVRQAVPGCGYHPLALPY